MAGEPAPGAPVGGNTAYGRLCEARDVSHFVAYLLSEPVKLFTGSVLVLDGGISSQGW